MRVLFVCTANTCRSPMLESMFANHIKLLGMDNISTASAGLYADGQMMSVHTQSVLKKHGIPFVARKSVRCDRRLIEWCDIVFTMTDKQKIALESACKNDGLSVKIISLSTLAKGDIQDPYGKDESAYEEVYQTFDKLLNGILYLVKQAR